MMNKIDKRRSLIIILVTLACSFFYFKFTYIDKLTNNNYQGITCGRYPNLVDLNITDTYWHVTNTSNGTFYLYKAYFDNRVGIGNDSIIRILGMINQIDPEVVTYCQLWFDGNPNPVISKVHEYRRLWPKYWSQNKAGATPFIISCINPLSTHVPKSVSLSEEPCGAANNLMNVKNKRPIDGRKKLFIVSVKKLDFDTDISLLLIEWCEILKILGVDHVEVFVVKVHENTERVLSFYQGEGFVTVKRLLYPHELPNTRDQSWHQWIQNELICLQDTFYENLYSYEYMVPMDSDEFIFPVREATWKDLMMATLTKANEQKKEFDAFPVTNQYFLLKSVHENETIEGVPKELRFLSNIYKTSKLTPNGGNAKSFLRTDRVLAVHNHFPFACVGPEKCRLFYVSPNDAHLSHYRDDCFTDECEESKANPIMDTSLWRFKSQILKGVEETRRKLRELYEMLDN